MAHARATATHRNVTQRIEGTIRSVRSHQKVATAERPDNTGLHAPSVTHLRERLERAFASIAFAEAGEPETALRMLRGSH